jgi:hypothetical protein
MSKVDTDIFLLRKGESYFGKKTHSESNKNVSETEIIKMVFYW